MSARQTHEDHLLSFNEVAKRLCMSDRTLRRRVSEGAIPAPLRQGKRKVYKASQMPELIRRALDYKV